MGLYDIAAIPGNAVKETPVDYNINQQRKLPTNDFAGHPDMDTSGEVEGEHYRLKRSIIRLNEKLNVLKDRLHPIRSSHPTDIGDDASYARPSSPLARSLQDDAVNVDNMTNLVTTLLEELTLP